MSRRHGRHRNRRPNLGELFGLVLLAGGLTYLVAMRIVPHPVAGLIATGAALAALTIGIWS
jgi:hypothetical protein